MRPNVDDLRESLDAIWKEQGSIGYLAFSGGSLFNRTKEADAFLRYMEAARETGLPLPATVAAIQALDRPDSARLCEAGFDYACYSMEVWDEPAWQAVLPGKARSVGSGDAGAATDAAVARGVLGGSVMVGPFCRRLCRVRPPSVRVYGTDGPQPGQHRWGAVPPCPRPPPTSG